MAPTPPISTRCPIVVRPCGWHEVEQLRALRARALDEQPHVFRQTIEEHQRVSPQAWRDHFAARATVGDGALVAEACGRWVGLAFAIHCGELTGRLGGLWVAPEARRRGAGRALLNAALAWLRAGNVHRVVTWITTTNAAAQELFRTAGFAPNGVRSALRPDAAAILEEFEVTLATKSLRCPPPPTSP